MLGISIPPCPTSLSSIMREAKRPSVDIKHLAKVIGRDAGIVGPLLKLANSPYIGLKNKVTSIFEAISVLGVQNTLNLVQNIALRQSVDGKSQNFEKFWERSSLEASIAEKIAAKFHGVSSDDAYLAALFHDCGIPILIMKFPGYRETVIAQCKLGKNISDVENDFFSLSHSVVGNMLTRNWMLPAHISKAILYHHDPTIFATQHESVGTNVLTLISILHMTECIVDDHLHVRDKEWPKFQHAVLKHLDMTEHEFSELKGDFLAVLNGE
ncbi:MAG: HDOD domain-containing protein [Nitrosomonadales bacterium]|nr:HDOD domain-containing protein [Nitrosomonadales bacterium]